MHGKTKGNTVSLLACGALLAAAAWLWANHHTIAVVNDSGKSIATISIKTRSDSFRFDNLAPGETRSSSFSIKGDDSFLVEGKFEDGTAFTGRYGYVTNGEISARVRLSIQPDGKAIYEEKRGI